MSAKNGLVFSPRPFEVYSALQVFRLQKALACLDGPLMLEDLKNDRIMRSVYATVISIMDRKIVMDECHFGIIDHPQFHVFALIVQQKKFDLQELASFQYIDGKIDTEKMLDIVDSYTTIVHLVEQQIHAVETVEFLEMEPYEMFPLNEPLMDKPLVGFDVVEFKEEDDVYISDTCGYINVKKAVVSNRYTYVQTPLFRHYPMENLGCMIERGSYELTVEGGYFLVPDNQGIVVTKHKIVGDDVENNYPYTVYAESELLLVKVKMRFTIRVKSRFRKVSELSLVSTRYTNKVKQTFDWLIKKMCMLPRTPLVLFNIEVLEACIIGLRMPSRELLCQSFLMIEACWILPIGYNKLLEKWRFYHRYENWLPLFQQCVMENKVIRNILSIFDYCKFDYRGDVAKYYNEDIIPYPHEYDGYMTYSEYIKFCGGSGDVKPRYDDTQKSLLLIGQMTSEYGISFNRAMYPGINNVILNRDDSRFEEEEEENRRLEFQYDNLGLDYEDLD